MQPYRSTLAALSGAAVVASWVLVGAGQAKPPQTTTLPLEPARDSGQSVTPAFEGWFPNPDGTFTLLLGYFNRNRTQQLDIPIGPNNRIEPGGPDLGQPTHFLTRRHYGMFGIVVPKDFGTRKLTWTLVSAGETNSIPVGLHPNYYVEPFRAAFNGNTPPVLRFDPKGPTLTGPPRGFAATLSANVNEPVTLTLWAADKPPEIEDEEPQQRRTEKPRPPITITWTRYRGPADVKFSKADPDVDLKEDGKATTTATFTAPGEYWLLATANDSSGPGGGGNQCCWTNAHVKVTVK